MTIQKVGFGRGVLFLPLLASSLAGQMFGQEILRPAFQMDPSLASGGFASSSSLSAIGGVSSLTGAAFDITINYTGPSQFQAAFSAAEGAWEAILPRYLDGNFGGAPLFDLTINATMEYIDGAGNILGSAGPTHGGVDDAGFLLATQGLMRFDTSDFSTNSLFFQNVVLHEMGHIIGIGTLWEQNGLYDDANPTVTDAITGEQVGMYTGVNALAGFRSEFGLPSASFVPVERGGGAGTANGHWDEGDGGGATGRVSGIAGEDMSGELMTGWANGGLYISNVTRGGLQDLGYDAVILPVPEPSQISLVLIASLALLRRRRSLR